MTIPDRAFRDHVLQLAGVDTLEELSPDMLVDIRHLIVDDKGIESIEGIHHLKNLERIDLSFNPLVDVTPLASLARLSDLDLGFTPVENLAPLARLPALEVLYFGNTDVIFDEELRQWYLTLMETD